MSVDLTALGASIACLQQGWVRYRIDTGDLLIRDGLTHRFKLTYRLSLKYLGGALVSRSPAPTSFDELMTTAADRSLLEGSGDEWREFRRVCTIARRAYDDDAARQVMGAVPAFLKEVKKLALRLGDTP